MADTPYTGLTAKVMIGEKLLCYVSGVDLSLEKDIIEILAFGMNYKEKVPAIKDWSASIDGTCALADGNSQDDLYDAFESGAALSLSIFLNASNKFVGTAFVQSFNISAAPDDKINLTSELAGSGAVVLTYGTLYTVTGAGDLEDEVFTPAAIPAGSIDTVITFTNEDEDEVTGVTMGGISLGDTGPETWAVVGNVLTIHPAITGNIVVTGAST